jgi:integrase
MVTTAFFLDGRKGVAPYPLKLRLTYARKSAYLSMNMKLELNQWDGARVIRHPRAQMLNNQLLARKAEIDNKIYQWHVNGELVGKEVGTIKAMLEVEDVNTDFLAYWQKAVARRTEKTQKVYKQALNSITGYDPRPSFDKIDIDWLIGFDRWMTKIMPSANTRSICMRCLRAVFNDALDDEVITYYPFRKYKIKQEPTRKKALTLEAVQTLLNWEVEEYQERYRDLFILMILMRGINIGDLCLLKWENVIDGRIEYRRQKTLKDYSIKIEPEMQEIMDRYRGKKYLLNVLDSYTSYENFKSRMNKGLKDVGEVKHLKQGRKKKKPLFPKLSTNWARHTFATIALNECGLPRDMISDLLGHSEGLDVTNIYIKKDLEKMDAAARKVIDKVMYGK